MDKCQGCVVLPIIFCIACFLLAGGSLVHILYLCTNYIPESLKYTEIFGFYGLLNYALINGLWKYSEM